MKKIKNQRNKYLEKLGISIYDYGTNCKPKDWKKEKRTSRWKKQRKKYGFDDRETWNLDRLFVEWLYSHLMMYKEIGGKIVDLNFHKFDYKGKKKEITQLEAINIICRACEDYLKADYITRHLHSEIFSENIMKLLGDIMPAMWW